MKYDFKTRVNRKEQGSIKWEDMFNKKENIKDKITPLSIADMEFKNAPEIIEGLKKYLDKTILGYTMATKKYKKVVCYWMKKRHNFEIYYFCILPIIFFVRLNKPNKLLQQVKLFHLEFEKKVLKK